MGASASSVGPRHTPHDLASHAVHVLRFPYYSNISIRLELQYILYSILLIGTEWRDVTPLFGVFYRARAAEI